MDEITPPKKSRDTSIVWTFDKSKKFYFTFTRSKAKNVEDW